MTDEQGRYTIVDLRPGTYTVTITLTGFNTFKSEGLELPSNFSATVNAELRVGALEESIIVTGLTPVVDVQSTSRTQVISRDLLDAVPTARNATGLASLMPGVRMTTTDVGGSQQMEQIYMTTQGSRRTDTTVQVDGMMMNALLNNGEVQAYFSDAAQLGSQLSRRAGAGADVSAGGVRINMIPKEGGNRFSGSAFVGGTDGDWQSDNVTDELRAQGPGLRGPGRSHHRLQLLARRPDQDATSCGSSRPGGGSRPTRSCPTTSIPTAVPASKISGFRIRWFVSPGR